VSAICTIIAQINNAKQTIPHIELIIVPTVPPTIELVFVVVSPLIVTVVVVVDVRMEIIIWMNTRVQPKPLPFNNLPNRYRFAIGIHAFAERFPCICILNLFKNIAAATYIEMPILLIPLK